MTTEVRKTIEDFFNRDNEMEGVDHYTTFDKIPKKIVKYLMTIWKL